MARVGPNQDINDSDTILSTATSYQNVSDIHGNLAAQSAAQNPSASGPPIVDISIPLKMSDGSTQQLDADDIGSPETGELVSNATIVTYIDLPERFREYWELLNASLDQINDYEFLTEEDIDPEIIIGGGGDDGELGTLGGTSFTLTSQTFFPSNQEPKPTPEWTGEGPTNYNNITWPQLLSELGGIAIVANPPTITSWETDYRYMKSQRATSQPGAEIGSWAGPDTEFAPGDSSVQFYNDSASSIFIDYSASASYSAIARVIDPDPDPSFPDEVTLGIHAESWAEIRNLNDYPTGVMGVHYPSFQQMSDFAVAGTGSVETVNVSISESVEVPPGKSVFIGVRTKRTGNGPPLAIGSWTTTIQVEDETITHGHTYPA